MDNDTRQHVTELADRYGRVVFAASYRILGNAHDAEDVLQEVFLKLLRTWGRNADAIAISDWGPYLRTTATRAALDLLRRKRRRDNRERLLWDVMVQNQESREAAAVEEKITGVRQAMAALSPRDACVFSLRHFENLSYEEIAAQTGLSVDLVGVTLHRARKVVRDVFMQIEMRQRAGQS